MILLLWIGIKKKKKFWKKFRTQTQLSRSLTFSGKKGDSPHQFIAGLERLLALCKLSNSDTIAAIAELIEEPAASFFRPDQAAHKNFKDFKKYFLELFAQESAEVDTLALLFSRKQKYGERVLNFIGTTRGLSASLPEGEKIGDERLTKIIRKNLQQPFRLSLGDREFTSMKEFSKACVRIEGNLEDETSSPEVAATELRCFGCGEKGHFKRECPKIQVSENTEMKQMMAELAKQFALLSAKVDQLAASKNE